MTDQGNVRLNILMLLDKTPELVNNYNKLCVFYWDSFDNVSSIIDICNATPVETINRNLRKLIASGLVTPPERRVSKNEGSEPNYESEFNHLI